MRINLWLLDMRVHAARKPTAQIRPFELQRGLVTGKKQILGKEGNTSTQKGKLTTSSRTPGCTSVFSAGPGCTKDCSSGYQSS